MDAFAAVAGDIAVGLAFESLRGVETRVVVLDDVVLDRDLGCTGNEDALAQGIRMFVVCGGTSPGV